MIEFKAWPKTPRLFRDMTITEKIDGTNAAVQIIPLSDEAHLTGEDAQHYVQTGDGEEFLIIAQSRKRIITPGLDNAGFARWVTNNAFSIIEDLGPGIHFGEWWGQGIQRNYGLDHKRFSLFNTTKWAGKEFLTPNLGTVPVLYEGPFSLDAVEGALWDLEHEGSYAAPFDNPEGVIVFHHALNSVFKATIKDDEAPKSLVTA